MHSWKPLLIIALIIGGIFSLAASSAPDGLERVAEDQGFIDRSTSYITGMIPDYAFPGMGNEYFATAFAGILGTLAVITILLLIGKLPTLRKRPQR